jgi:hypothetical protein
MSLCNAPNSCRCDHKRNAGNGVVKCAIDANKEICTFSITAAEVKAKIDAADK